MERQPAPHRDQVAVMVRQAAGHFAMGASLGATGALVLIIENLGPLRDSLGGADASGLGVAVFVGASAFLVAIGATVTGFILAQSDQD